MALARPVAAQPCALVLALTLVTLALPGRVQADEGWWPFDALPLAALRERIGSGAAPDAAGLQQLQQATVQIGAGSGAFVSRQGLVLTSQSVLLDCLARLSDAQHDLVATGFQTRPNAAEPICPGLQARSLVSSDDVSTVVEAALTGEPDPLRRHARRQATLAEIERACQQASGLHCEVVAQQRGARHHLYRYQVWTDLRLVFAPEVQAARYGGEADQLAYPRHALDFALLRVYDQGRPLVPRQILPLATQPLAEGDALLLAAYPQASDRQATLAQWQVLRDTLLPLQRGSLRARRAAVLAHAASGSEAARSSLPQLLALETRLETLDGEASALRDDALVGRKADEEAAQRRNWTPPPGPPLQDPWSEIETASREEAAWARERWAVSYPEQTLFETAGRLVELAQERQRPTDARLAPYRDSRLIGLERGLRSEQPIDPGLEVRLLASWLQEARELLGAAHPYVQAALTHDGSDATPEQAAQRLVGGSRLGELKERIALLDGGVAAVEASTDPLIALARAVYPLRRERMLRHAERVEVPVALAMAAIVGPPSPSGQPNSAPAPDANGTLRLSFGRALGYTSQGSTWPWKTTFGGLLARADGFDQHAPFDLSARLAQARAKLDPRQPLNVALSIDALAGQSGAAVVNPRGEWVGVAIDPNHEALSGRFAYLGERARLVALHAGAILHALERVYGAPHLVRELREGDRPAPEPPAPAGRRR
jgi:hypothetical protein